MKPRIPLPHPLDSAPFTASQGLDAGLGRRRMRGRDLARPFRGVYVATTGGLSLLERCRALELRMPSDAFFSGVTAALLLGAPLPRRLEESRVVHVSVRAPHRAPTGKGVQGHSVAVDPQDIRLWNGLAVSSPARAWCELAASVRLPDLVAAGDYLIHWKSPLATRAELETMVARFLGRPGSRILRDSLPLLDDRSESRPESQLRVLLVLGGVTGVLANFPIRTSGGFRYRADLAIPERRFIIEYQSAFHEGAVRFRADMTRISRLGSDDWYVMQVNGDDLDTPAELLSRIERTLAGRPYFNS